jgi:bifunctional N-acetylglucosamine-1-phosphate-uridyltransferase/glucosamine-1-phosphate-acetyltransferase GlmU-like protein
MTGGHGKRMESNMPKVLVNTKEQLETLNLHILESGYQFD